MKLSQFRPRLFRSEESSENGVTPPKKRFRLRPWLYILGGLGITGAVFFLFRPSPIVVDVATVKREELSVTITEEGETRVRDRYVVSSPVAGYLQRLELDEGDTITAGETIAQIDPLILDSEVQSLLAEIESLKAEKSGVATLRPKSAALTQAEANISATESQISASKAVIQELQARLQQAKHDRARAEFLRQQGAISEQALESAQLNETAIAQSLAVAQQDLNRAQAELKRAQARREELQAEQQDPDYLLSVYDSQIRSLEAQLAERTDRAQRTKINSPANGQVLRIHQKSEQYVEAGVSLLELGNPKDLELVVDVLSTDATQIERGDRVLIEQWGGDEPLVGTVRRIEPAAFTKVSALGVEEQRVNIIIDFVDIPNHLGDQYRVEAQIVVWEQEDILQIPISSLFRCEQGWCIFTVENGKAERIPVEIGQRNNLAAQVKSGLEEGEQVILYPSERIEAGTKITPSL
ncbi:MAG: HlyD family efflux transporter periplasmic adaptor subunit [Cyanobacteria bacterium]|jgi:HlyD family secretion protein|nr:HlyD family efflux transporter periplasmic adaptor subunit [Cyanobacteria bacterium GSL.Bin1]